MEFNTNHQEESMKYSREEAEQESTYIRVGRFYECVFCKRGFNTAQALGGHMNIHRKERARNKPNSTTSRQEEDYTGHRFYQQIPVSINDHKYATYFTGNSTMPSYENPPQQRYSMNDRDRHKRMDQSINPSDGRVRLDEFPPVIMGGLETSQEEELDLELRLGYDS